MHKQDLPWLIIALAVVTLFAMMLKQNQDLRHLRSALASVPAQTTTTPSNNQIQPVAVPTQPVAVVPTPIVATSTVPAAAPSTDGFTTITQRTVFWNNQALQFEHQCKGKPTVANLFGDPSHPISFCEGESQLVVTGPKMTEKVLATWNGLKWKTSDDPVFINAELVLATNVTDQRILLSYQAEACTTVNDCGAGMATNYVSYVYNPSNTHISDLKNYPSYGTPIWNADASKAIFIPSTCGGGGCDVQPLSGYNMRKDTVKDVTTIKASEVGGSTGAATDVQGNPLPVWQSVTWKSLTTFAATYTDTNGTLKTVNGTF